MDQLVKILGVTTIRYFIIAGLPFLVFYWLYSSKLTTSKIQAKLAGKSDFMREIKNSMVTAVIFSIIGVLVLYSPLSQYTLVYHQWDTYPLWWIPVSLVLSLVIHDSYFYWMHRLLHHRKLYRHTHLEHHRSTNPSPFASYSFHFVESITEGAILLVLAFVLPMHPLSIFLFVVVGLVINVYGHLGYEIAPRWLRHSLLFEVINTSVHHNLHHSKFNGNYGLYFRLWDRICGTEHPDYVKEYDRVQRQRFGEEVRKQPDDQVPRQAVP